MIYTIYDIHKYIEFYQALTVLLNILSVISDEGQHIISIFISFTFYALSMWSPYTTSEIGNTSKNTVINIPRLSGKYSWLKLILIADPHSYLIKMSSTIVVCVVARKGSKTMVIILFPPLPEDIMRSDCKVGSVRAS